MRVPGESPSLRSIRFFMSKTSRQAAIRNLIERRPVANQEELCRLLEKQGFEITQATVSRDIREMGVMKGPEGYLLPGAIAIAAAADAGPSIETLLREFVTGVKQAQNLLVVRTTSGSAQPVAVAIDNEQWDEVVGTVGGDDTVLLICAENKSAARVKARVEEYIL